jgi:type 2A phosphatase activator TIP41
MPPENVASSAAPKLLGEGEGIDLNRWEMRAFNGPIVSSLREAELAKELNIRLPGMLFGDSTVSLVHTPSRFALSFTARDALREVGPADPAVQVRAAQVWARRKNSNDFPALENPSDWTFTTKYSGTVTLSPGTPEAFQGCETLCDRLAQIDYDVLRNTDIPILYFTDVLLFEDELDDNGTASFRVRMVRLWDLFVFTPSIRLFVIPHNMQTFLNAMVSQRNFSNGFSVRC